jgi:hypothetical protein
LLEALSNANKRADALALKLEQSEKAREKAESDAAAIEGIRKRLHDAENSLIVCKIYRLLFDRLLFDVACERTSESGRYFTKLYLVDRLNCILIKLITL